MTARGVAVLGGDVLSCGRIARAADEAGLGAVWTAEYYGRSATITMAQMAHSTTSIQIGSAIAYGVGRTPMMTIAEARDLDTISRGRVVLGLGLGSRRIMRDWHGMDDIDSPALRMEELLTLLRKLMRLHEGPVQHEGRFYRVDIRPSVKAPEPLRPDIPLYIAAVNRRMLESAGRVADGVLLHPIVGPRYIDEVVRPALAAGAERTGRVPGDVTVVAMPICSIHENRDQARREAAAQIAFYMTWKSYAAVHDFNGFGSEAAEIRSRFGQGDVEGMIDVVSDRMIDELAVAGTASEVREGLERYDAVVDHVAMYSPSYLMDEQRVESNTLALIAQGGRT